MERCFLQDSPQTAADRALLGRFVISVAGNSLVTNVVNAFSR